MNISKLTIPKFNKIKKQDLTLMVLTLMVQNGKTKDTRLWRRFSQVEKLPPPKRKQIVQILDAFLGSEKAKKSG